MTFQSDIASDVQRSAVGDMIFLYEIDLTNVGLSETVYFTEAVDDDYTAISFNSRTYQPIQMEATGFEVSGEGTLPRPSIKVSNVLLTFADLVLTYDDLIGAKFTRRRTLKKYLDGESEANPSAEFPHDVYVIFAKTSHDKYEIEFELSAYMDFEGVMIPKRQIIRDFCSHRYRYWDGSQFKYDLASCPYGPDQNDIWSYDRLTEYTTVQSDDSCGKMLRDCEVRFAGRRARRSGKTVYIQDTDPGGSNGELWLNTGSAPNVWYIKESGSWVEYKPDALPTRAFPGVGRFKL